jgi:tetratricopeptide (TPR) repeat protein/two-component sensor histidine kinase
MNLINIKPTHYLSLLFFIVLLLSFSCKNTKTKELKTQEKQINELIQQSQDSAYQNILYSKAKIRQALLFVPDSITFYEVLSKLASCYFIENKYDSAKIEAVKILRFCHNQTQTSRIQSLIAESENAIGNYYTQMSIFDSAYFYYHQAYKDVLTGNRREKLPDICINVADSHVHKGDYSGAAFYYRRALSISDSLNVTGQMGFPIYFGLGQVYMELRDFELSDNYYNLAWKYYASRNLKEKFTYCNNRGNFYYYKEDYAEALPWFQRARALVLPGNYIFYINLCEGNMGDIYLRLNKLDSAQYYLDRSFNYFASIKNQSALYYLATAKAGLAIKQHNNQLAHKYLNEYEAPVGVDPDLLLIRYKYLQDYYLQTSNYKQAYFYQSKNIQLNDSIRTERVRKRAAEIDMRYSQDTTLIRQKMLIYNQYNKMKNMQLTNYIWILLAVILLVLLVSSYLYLKKKHDLEWIKHLNQITRLRMESIRNRISPHFVFNVLNREISNEEDKEKHKQLSGLVKLLRQSLELTEHLSISLDKEMEFVNDYIKLEQVSLGPDFQIKWDIDSSVSSDKVFLPAMIMQIPVENALKHALRNKQGNKLLNISISKYMNGVKISIQDNGPGYKPTKISSPNSTGTGLKVLSQTIQLLNNQNSEKIEYIIKNVDEPETGTKVEIKIPDHYSYEL